MTEITEVEVQKTRSGLEYVHKQVVGLVSSEMNLLVIQRSAASFFYVGIVNPGLFSSTVFMPHA